MMVSRSKRHKLNDHFFVVNLILSVYFTLQILLYPTLFILWKVYFKSNFYIYFALPFLIWDLITLGIVLFVNAIQHENDFQPLDMKEFLYYVYLPIRLKYKNFFTVSTIKGYKGFSWIMFIVLFTIWFRPLFLYLEVTGVYPNYAKRSSCVSTYPGGIPLDARNYAYNPLGSFPHDQPFDVSIDYGNAVLNTRWADSTDNIITGYNRLSGGDLDCNSPNSVNGFIFPIIGRSGCDNSNFEDTLAFGISADGSTISPQPLDTLTSENTIPCPSTVSATFELQNGRLVNGYGRKICSKCLGYFEDLAGGDEVAVLPGYEHCTTDGKSRPFWCFFTPGGFNGIGGLNGFWLEDEIVEEGHLAWAFWLFTLVTFSMVIRVFFLDLVSSFVNEKHATNSSKNM